MNEGKFFYTVTMSDGTKKTVSGEPVGNYFAVQQDKGKGWRITHLPTGQLLVTAGMASKGDAIGLVTILECYFKNVWTKDFAVIEKAIFNSPYAYLINFLRKKGLTNEIVSTEELNNFIGEEQ